MEQFAESIEVLLRMSLACSGAMFVGLTVLREDARGRFHMVGFENGPLFDPRYAWHAQVTGGVFGLCVLLSALRYFG